MKSITIFINFYHLYQIEVLSVFSDYQNCCYLQLCDFIPILIYNIDLNRPL